MKKIGFTDEQVIRILKEVEAGAQTPELCRRHGISAATSYNWKGTYGGMTVSDARQPKDREAGDAKLKKLLAESEFDKASLKDLLSRKWCAHGPGARLPRC